MSLVETGCCSQQQVALAFDSTNIFVREKRRMDEKLITETGVLSTSDACRLLNVSRTTLWRLRRAGRVKYLQLGSRIGYLLTHIHEFMHSCERKGQNNEAI
jgi:excisionase family DNA binding protein